jgi:hypothetical protein
MEPRAEGSRIPRPLPQIRCCTCSVCRPNRVLAAAPLSVCPVHEASNLTWRGPFQGVAGVAYQNPLLSILGRASDLTLSRRVQRPSVGTPVPPRGTHGDLLPLAKPGRAGRRRFAMARPSVRSLQGTELCRDEGHSASSVESLGVVGSSSLPGIILRSSTALHFPLPTGLDVYKNHTWPKSFAHSAP